MTEGPLLVDVVDLRRDLGSFREIERSVEFDDMRVGEREIVDGRVDVALTVASITDAVVASATAIVASGTLSFTASGPCRRCLEPVRRELAAEIQEIFEDVPTDGDTWPIDDGRIDLGAVVREEALLSLPVTALCSDGCAGPDPERFPTSEADADSEADGAASAARDPRWAALDELDLENRG